MSLIISSKDDYKLSPDGNFFMLYKLVYFTNMFRPFILGKISIKKNYLTLTGVIMLKPVIYFLTLVFFVPSFMFALNALVNQISGLFILIISVLFIVFIIGMISSLKVQKELIGIIESALKDYII